MCGLVALAYLDGRPVDAELLATMAAALDHRGPDEEGQWVRGALGLHHKRLSIIDIEGGRQPMEADDVTLVFNGEIYNYLELREDLRARGHAFRTQSDTEVLLRAYLEWGEDCVRRLNGMFAFVVVDRRENRLLAARDHFGVKPLYVHAKRAGHRMYASEIKALLRHPDVTAVPNRTGLDDYLTFQFVLGDATLFEGVTRVRPGHYEVVDLADGAVRSVKYWEPRFVVDGDVTEAQYSERLRALLEDAVRLQMRSDVPVGAHLSGGMDSSLLTLLAAPLSGTRFKTFSGGFHEGAEFNELPYAREVAAQAGAQPFEVFPTASDFVELLPDLIHHLDEPVAGPGVFPQYMVSRLAAGEVKVVLGGQGGDEVFGGYARYLVAYLEQVLKGAIFETNDEGEHIVSLGSILPNLPFLRQYVPMLKRFWAADVFESMDRRYFRLLDRSEGTLAALSGDWRGRYEREAIFARFQQAFNHPDTQSYYNRMTHFDLIASLPALLHVEDRMSMAVSLESRVPLLDHRISDLVGSMPPACKFRGGEMKYILKRAVTDLLPPSILARKDKMGFPVPLHLWARGAARDFFHDVLTSSACRSRGLFDADAVAALLDDEAPFSRRLWGLLNLELWHRRFIDR